MKNLYLAFVFLCCAITSVFAASSFDHTTPMLNARLIAAEDGVAPTASTLSAGVVIELTEGWKTYWKSPGQVGYPTSVTWDGSENIKDVEIMWPAPKRFVAFDIENYGYEGTLVHPLKVTLSELGQAARLKLNVSLLVCADVCVPQDFSLAVSIPEGSGIDTEAAMIIADAAGKIPLASDASDIELTSTVLSPDKKSLSVALSSAVPLTNPTAFFDLGLEAAFGPPETAIAANGTSAVITLPVLALPETLPPADLTITDGARAVSFSPDITTGTLTASSTGLMWTLLLAFVGGLILNVMPCVLPVLSIKFASALKSADQSRARIRSGFLVSALGVLAFMWSLALILIAIRQTGGQVGWGLQFQNPIFLAIMVSIMVLFAANLAGLFEINLPQSWTTKMAQADGQPGLMGDFATGALAAVMATPCSAPFLGTAVTFALAGSNFDTLAIFTALGLGLALPYVLIALRPGLIQRLPKPGAWMNMVKLVLALMMAATAIWLSSVLMSVIGATGLVVLLAVLVIMIAAFSLTTNKMPKIAGLAAVLVAISIVPNFTAPPQAKAADSIWMSFAEQEIPTYVSAGHVIFVDVTADWCLTCKANKSLVLDRAEVKTVLTSDEVMAMQADWTRPNPDILAYLQENGRFGIPFNIVYGPNAPQGIALPEILTKEAVLTAIERAR